MGIARFSIRNLCDKVFSEYKLQPRHSRGSNPEAEIFIVWLIVSSIYLIERQAVFRPKGVTRMKMSSGYKVHVSWLAAMIFANQFLGYGLKPLFVNEQEYLELNISSDSIELVV